MASIAICFLYDILLNCGPDCEDLYDLFTNDSRDTSSEFIDINEWENTRCTVMGKNGKIRQNRWKIRLGQFYKPAVPLKSSLKFDEISNSDDIADGEKIITFKPKVYKEEECFLDEKDDDIEAPETDVVYHNRVSRTMTKYDRLISINQSWHI